MNDIVTYTNEIFGTLRVLDIDNQPWFIGKEVAEKLGYKKPRNAIKQHCKGALKWGVPTN